MQHFLKMNEFFKKERKKKQKRKNKTPSSRCLGTTFDLVSNDFDSFVESFLEIISFFHTSKSWHVR